jgi:hypothetical protein
MPKVCYVPKNLSTDRLAVIATVNEILEDYAAQGYDLTLRQLYYQFVSRGLIANKDTEYKNLGSLVNDARLAGLVDWNHITDRTRNVRANSHWDSPASIVESCAKQFELDKWEGQPNYVEVWVEKDALVGVLEVACQPLDVPYFSCRGYTSQSEMWGAAMRLLSQFRSGHALHIIHLGDHDPSGIDMTRDIQDRLNLFLRHHVGHDIAVNRVALNMNQIRRYKPPPNPAKLTDSRAAGCVEQFGDESWELDALEPSVLNALITREVKKLRDEELWDAVIAEENLHKESLEDAAARLASD